VIEEIADWPGHPADVLQSMRDRLAEAKRLGIEAIND
jgi:hypothetical protein